MKLLLAAREGEAHFHLLDDVSGVEIDRASSPEECLEKIRDVDVLYGFPTPDLIEAAERLRWIQAPSAGVDFVWRVPNLVGSDIILTNTRGAHATPIAEHTFGLIFAFTRGIPTCLDWQRDKHWGRNEGYRALSEIAGLTMGIVGYGQIGRAVAKRAQAFDLELLAVDAHPFDDDPYVGSVWPVERLHDLLERSDIVVIAAPYTPQTRHLIDAQALAKMRPTSYLLAVSRGGIVDEAALADALRGGRLAGAGIDVAEREPLSPESPLWDLPNVIITPHVAGSSTHKERRCVEILRENLIRFSNGESLINLVDKQRGY